MMLVYIPERCCNESFGYLLGCVDVARSVCCITGVIPFSDNKFRSFPSLTISPQCTCGIIGVWRSDSDSTIPSFQRGINHSRGVEHLLLLTRRANKLHATWNASSITQHQSDDNDELVIVLYESIHFSNSVVVRSGNIHTNLADETVLTNSSAILQAFCYHKQLCSSIEAAGRTFSLIDFTGRETNVLTAIKSRAYRIAVYFLSIVLAFCSSVCSFRFVAVTVINVKKLNSLTATLPTSHN